MQKKMFLSFKEGQGIDIYDVFVFLPRLLSLRLNGGNKAFGGRNDCIFITPSQ